MSKTKKSNFFVKAPKELVERLSEFSMATLRAHFDEIRDAQELNEKSGFFADPIGHFNEGLELAEKALKAKKGIVIFADEDDEISFYHVGDLRSATKLVEKLEGRLGKKDRT